jgi:hypothetical protein
MAGDADNDGGRVTTREFYDALIKQNTVMMETERRIMTRLDAIIACLPKIENQLATNKEEIKQLRNRSNINDVAVAIAAAIGSAIAAILGVRNGGTGQDLILNLPNNTGLDMSLPRPPRFGGTGKPSGKTQLIKNIGIRPGRRDCPLAHIFTGVLVKTLNFRWIGSLR